MLVVREELLPLILHMLPLPKFGSQCVSSLVQGRVTTGILSPFVGGAGLSATEVSRHCIDASFVHVVLIYLNRVPVVEVALRCLVANSQHLAVTVDSSGMVA